MIKFSCLLIFIWSGALNSLRTVLLIDSEEIHKFKERWAPYVSNTDKYLYSGFEVIVKSTNKPVLNKLKDVKTRSLFKFNRKIIFGISIYHESQRYPIYSREFEFNHISNFYPLAENVLFYVSFETENRKIKIRPEKRKFYTANSQQTFFEFEFESQFSSCAVNFKSIDFEDSIFETNSKMLNIRVGCAQEKANRMVFEPTAQIL